mgnify:FL=1
MVGFAAKGLNGKPQRRQPVILAGTTKRHWVTNSPWGAGTVLAEWHQSHFSQGQNAVGGLVAAALYLMDPPTVTAWNLPTSEDAEITNAALKPYGLVRYTDGATPIYATMWPQQRESDGAIQVCAGAWHAESKASIWIRKEGSYYVAPEDFLNQLFPTFTLFHVALDNWLFMVPNTQFASPRIYSANTSIGFVPAAGLGFAGETHNASVHAWQTGSGEEIVKNFYMFLPYFESGPAIDAVVNFMKLNPATGFWSRDATRTVEDLPVGGAAAVPDLIGVGNGAYAGPPAAWRGNEALIFVSGGTKDILDATKWQDVHWTLRSLSPADGTDGAFVKSKTITATDSPTLLSPGSMKAAVAAAAHTIFYSEAGAWFEGVIYSDDTDSAYEHFKRACPIILPVSAPNLGRLGTIESRMVNDSLDNPQWPTLFANSGGGPVVDEANTVWSVVLEPAQVLFGGHYTSEEIGTHPAYSIFTSLQVIGSPPVTGSFYVPESPWQLTMGEDTFFISEGESVGPVEHYEYDEFGNPISGYAYVADMGMAGTWELHTWKWNQYHGARWKTMLRGHRANSTTVEKDISQLVDASTTAAIGKPTGISTTVTQSLELADNVHPLISFADKNLVAILRDLHLDGAGNNPTPAIEIWQIGSTSATKLSTVRLGSYDETFAVETDLGENGTALAGDQEWDPYAFGPPRMKACRKSGTSNTPVIVAMVGENKKIHPDNDSPFKRVCYATIELNSPSSPDVVYSARTSEDLGVGNSGYPAGEDYWGPIWDSWDTLVLTPDHVAWIKDSEFRETQI